MKKILFLVNHDVVIYNFRRELVERLIEEGYEVIVSSPYGERIDLLVDIGCEFIEAKMDRHGKNPLSEFKLLIYYKRLISTVKPSMIFSYTIKPNLYGAIAAAKCNVPIVVNVTGLGTAIENHSLMKKCMVLLYKYAFKNVKTVFVQNKENKQFFIDNNIAVEKLKLLAGSGVNLNHFKYHEIENDKYTIEFAYIGRIMKDKGIDELLESITQIKKKYTTVNFNFYGFFDEDKYVDIFKIFEEKDLIKFHGQIKDIRPMIEKSDCIILPSYHEGMSNILLESAAIGRPVITTNVSGCKEAVDDNVTGFLIEKANIKDLVNKIENFLLLSMSERIEMGKKARLKIEKEFDRRIVVEQYLKTIEELGDK